MDELFKALANIEWAKPRQIEYRVYHDTEGRVLAYSNDDLPGAYVIVDRETWAANRYDWRVVKGQLVPPVPEVVKLKPSQKGMSCHPLDITILYQGLDAQYWEIEKHED